MSNVSRVHNINGYVPLITSKRFYNTYKTYYRAEICTLPPSAKTVIGHYAGKQLHRLPGKTNDKAALDQFLKEYWGQPLESSPSMPWEDSRTLVIWTYKGALDNTLVITRPILEPPHGEPNEAAILADTDLA